jgi:hypothetical protein
MSIPLNPAVPAIPMSPDTYQQQIQEQYSSVLRLYFYQLNGALDTAMNQVASNQALIWLNANG